MVRPLGSEQLILLLCVAGQGWVELRGRRHLIGLGDLALIPPWVGHEYGAGGDPWSICWFHVGGARLSELGPLLGLDSDDPVLLLTEDPGMTSTFEEVFGLLSHGYTLDRMLLASGLIKSLLGKLAVLRRQGTIRDTGVKDQVLRVQAWMRDHLSTPVTVSELAAMANLSASHFSAVFRQVTGVPVLAYSLRLRLLKACQLLDATDLSVKEIAERVGFSDQLYFSRMFRGVYGIPPRQYRKVKKG